MSKVNIQGLNKAAVLAGLYNAAIPLGLGKYADDATCAARGSRDMSVSEAADYLGAHGTRFDYVHGRVVKTDIGGDEVDSWLYDRDNGEGALARVIDAVRAAG